MPKQPSDASDHHELEVETVFNFFSLLESDAVRRAFFDECKKKGLRLKASSELYLMGRAALAPQDGTETAGPDCPACPPRR